MSMKRASFLCGLAALLLSIGDTWAAGAPAQLYNKAIRVSFTVSVDARAPDGSRSTHPRSVDRVIYVSTKGRVFVRSSRRVGRYSSETERGPAVTSSAFRFSGNRMIGTMPFISGAGQLTVTFNSGFTGCTADAVIGHETGKSFTFKGLNGKTYTALGRPTISQHACSVSDGNPFAN
jgi:hypothetical protein